MSVCLHARDETPSVEVITKSDLSSKLVHYSDVIKHAMASQIASLAIVYSTVHSGADQRKHQSSASLAFVREIHWWPLNSPRKGPISRKKVFIWWRHNGVTGTCLIQIGCWTTGCWTIVFIFGTACQIYCYGRYCVRRSVSPQVPENPSGPLVDNFIVLPCVAFGVTCVKLLPGVDRWNSLDEARVIGPCHCEVWGWPRH